MKHAGVYINDSWIAFQHRIQHITPDGAKSKTDFLDTVQDYLSQNRSQTPSFIFQMFNNHIWPHEYVLFSTASCVYR